jgi:hypothetical protein
LTLRTKLSKLRTKSVIRVFLVVVLVLNLSFVASAYVTRYDSVSGPTTQTDIGDSVAGPANGTTVITTQGAVPSVTLPRSVLTQPNGALYAIDSDGDLAYRNGTYHAYFDVDPVANTSNSVSYIAHEYIPKGECETSNPCYVNRVERVNLTTGVVETVYTSTVSGPSGGNLGRWHDVDRYDEDSILVADIERDSAAVINTTSGLVEWEWQAESDFAPSSGGSYTGDWTHINDVELLEDGRVMADLRNHDAVVFIHPETGLQENWTLGADDNYDVLNEQHNPDYIPESRGGPAVIVADSENDRIVEYQRVDGDWEQSWVWQDSQMNWPRDADRLPNGNTLITDSYSNRVVEIDRRGEIVWNATTPNIPYEAERLGTGDESAGGESAARLELLSRTADRQGGPAQADSLVPDPVTAGIAFVTPPWMGLSHVVALLLMILVGLIWPVLEFRWSSYSLGIRSPVVFRQE